MIFFLFQILLFGFIQLTLGTSFHSSPYQQCVSHGPGGVDVSFTHTPLSSRIEVIEGGRYNMEIKSNPKEIINYCEYHADTGQKGEFIVSHPNTSIYGLNNYNLRNNDRYASKLDSDEKSKFVSFGIHSCELIVYDVNDKGPVHITLQAFHAEFEFNNITNETTIFNKTELCSVDFTITFFYKAEAFKSSVIVMEGESFYQHLIKPTEFKSCGLIINDRKISLPLNLGKSLQTFATGNKEIDDVITNIIPIGHNVCGFQLKDAKNVAGLTWTFHAVDSKNKVFRNIFTVRVENRPKLDVVNSVTMGDEKTIYCASIMRHGLCELYHPSGKLVLTGASLAQCSYKISSFSTNDIGDWKCLGEVSTSLKLIPYIFKLVPADEPKITKWVEKKGDYLNIGCQLPETLSNVISYCKITSPNKQKFSLQPGMATERYIPKGTNFENRTCSMMIKTPLHESENGVWLFEMGSNMATLISVGEVEHVSYPRLTQINTQIDENLAIFCQVPYYSDYCYIIAPNGTIYFDKNQYNSWIGKCNFDIEKVKEVHNGTWACSFARETGIPEEKIFVDVKIAEVLAFSQPVATYENSKAQLLCTTGGLAIKYCRFISPDGTGYHIRDDNNSTSGTIKYFGKGFNYGDCGIEITDVQLSHAGAWTCYTRIGTKSRAEISGQINMEVSPNLLKGSNLALILGVTVGVIVISSILSIIAVRKYRRRRHNDIQGSSSQERDVFEDLGASNQDIFNFDAVRQTAAYTNPQQPTDEGHAHQF